jgi:transcriptional regulator GlxA family with amidase domain
MNPKRIGILGFEGITALDLVGPAEAFATVRVGGERCYHILTIGLSGRPFTAESGVVFRPQKTLASAPGLDTVIIPSGCGIRHPATSARIAAWLRGHAREVRRIASVCTGIYGLAASGLLDGRRVTTHWRFARDVALRFPRLNIDPNALFIKDGRFYTSAGVTAGIDLSLALIEEDFGPSVALAVARELVVYLKRPGGQEQYSEPLRFQAQSVDRFADLAAWVAGHLDQDLSVETMAERTHLCPRHFSRRFKRAFGDTPAAFVEELRLGEAWRRLTAGGETINGVAASVGFTSADAFRRAFLRRFGLTPTSYRVRFPQHSVFGGLRKQAAHVESGKK